MTNETVATLNKNDLVGHGRAEESADVVIVGGGAAGGAVAASLAGPWSVVVSSRQKTR